MAGFLGPYNNYIEALLDINSEADRRYQEKQMEKAKELIDYEASANSSNSNGGNTYNITVNINIPSMKELENMDVKQVGEMVTSAIDNLIPMEEVTNLVEPLEEEPPKPKRGRPKKVKELEP